MVLLDPGKKVDNRKEKTLNLPLYFKKNNYKMNC